MPTCDFSSQKGNHLENALRSYQELEYGKAFCIVRPILDRIGATMLISGALGVFRRDVVIKLGGYARDTVGEDMELVMRIRQYAAESGSCLVIGYAKDALCFTELPWKMGDLIKQRIRWTVGLSEVLWKYRSMAVKKEYRFLERVAFWYYLLFEKCSPHLECVSLLLCVLCGISARMLMLIGATVLWQVLLALAGSFSSVRNAINASKHRFGTTVRFLLLLCSFVSLYHALHSLVRLIAVPYTRIKKQRPKSKNVGWNSPTRS